MSKLRTVFQILKLRRRAKKVIKMNVLKSKTTQNVAATGTIAGVALALIMRFWPSLAEDQALQDAIIIMINAIGVPLVSRLLAFVRNPEKIK